MKWKAIGKSEIGTSHSQSGKSCEDKIKFDIVKHSEEEVLVCCISDGAGSAKYAEAAAELVTKISVEHLTCLIQENKHINEFEIFNLAEILYNELEQKAQDKQASINEFSSTFLGCVIYNNNAVFFKIGDGLIVREDNAGNYTSVLLPQNGEYSNSTNFLIDDINFPNLRILELDYSVNEVALTTDGLQLLILNNEFQEIHQPFFSDMFKWLRLANKEEQVHILSEKLSKYLVSEIINSKTDDDKTLFLATRLPND